MQLVEFYENPRMPAFFKPGLQKVIETVSECEQPTDENIGKRKKGRRTEMTHQWDEKTKLTDKLTFELHYTDGTSAMIEKGVLFSINRDNTMSIHVGVDKAWQLFGAARCLTDFIEAMGLGELFKQYLQEDFGDGKEQEGT